jgi:glycosyltransferase involved in cell wall biosynthesis
MDVAPQSDPSRTVVLQVVPALGGGGVERGTVEMAEAITRAGGLALVASQGGRLARLVEAVGGRNILLPLATKNPLGVWRNAARLAALIEAEHVNLVHARSRAPAWSAWLATQRTGVPLVTTYHGTYGEELPGKRRYNSVMARGERVIVISRFVATLVMRQHRVDPARLRVIHRGVDPAVFDPNAVSGERVQKLAEAWHLPEARPLVMLPGRLTRWKGQEVLIEALARMSRRDAVGVLVGGDQGRGRYARSLLAQAAQLGVTVRLVGDCEDMPAALMLADVVVNASTKPEGFGRVVIEAQAMGRPVIATDHGGAVETVDHGSTGWRVPPGDPTALAAFLDHVLASSPERLAAFGARARASVQAHYTVANMQAATLDVYREVLEEHAQARERKQVIAAVAAE